MELIAHYKKLFIWLMCCMAIITFIGMATPASFAAVLMVWGEIILWVMIGGKIMFSQRDAIKKYVQSLRYSWQCTFILFATLLALLEEAIATLMTNLAPLFGVGIGEAYLTASTNFFDVALFHSVVLFVPMFYGWTRLLAKYRFTPSQVFWLFGLTGMCAEFLFNRSPIGISGLWIFVYGLMVYLPAYTLPERPKAVVPEKKHFIVAIVYPFIFVVATIWIPFVLQHPSLHF